LLIGGTLAQVGLKRKVWQQSPIQHQGQQSYIIGAIKRQDVSAKKKFRFADFCSVFVRVIACTLPIEVFAVGTAHSASRIIVNGQHWEKKWTAV